MCFEPDVQQRDIGRETRDTLQAQIDLAPDMYRVEKQYAPQYSALRQGELETMMTGANTGKSFLDLYRENMMPEMTGAQIESNTAQRTADLADLSRYGSQVVSAIKGANPQQAALEDAINGQIMKMLGTDGLSGQDQRTTQQAIRSAQASRGMGMGQGDSLAELLALDRAGQDRTQSRLGTAMGWANQQHAMTADPAMVLLGKQSSTASPVATAVSQNQGQLGQSSGMFNPFNAYAADLNSSNQNAAASAAASGNNLLGGIVGGVMGLGGSLGGGWLGGRGGGRTNNFFMG